MAREKHDLPKVDPILLMNRGEATPVALRGYIVSNEKDVLRYRVQRDSPLEITVDAGSVLHHEAGVSATDPCTFWVNSEAELVVHLNIKGAVSAGEAARAGKRRMVRLARVADQSCACEAGDATMPSMLRRQIRDDWYDDFLAENSCKMGCDSDQLGCLDDDAVPDVYCRAFWALCYARCSNSGIFGTVFGI